MTPELQVCLTWSIFFSTRTSEQYTATADLVNFFIISYRFRLNIQTSSGSLNKIVLELILWLMVIVQITFQQGCELQKHPQTHNVQDMIKILCNVENVQCLILGKRVAQLRCIRKRLVLYFKYLLETEKPSMMPTIITVINVPFVTNAGLNSRLIELFFNHKMVSQFC